MRSACWRRNSSANNPTSVGRSRSGGTLELDGKPLAYNRKEDILNPWFMVRGSDDRDWLAPLS